MSKALPLKLSSSEWSLREDDHHYLFQRKHYNGPNFRKTIRLSKESVMVKKTVDGYEVERRRKE